MYKHFDNFIEQSQHYFVMTISQKVFFFLYEFTEWFINLYGGYVDKYYLMNITNGTGNELGTLIF